MAGIQPMHAKRLRHILLLLDTAGSAADVDAPGLRLHPLSGQQQGFWSVTVQANWRVIFRFEGHDVHLVDYLDYH
ncbi:type II toxin-antitoxin system RelE/ParE family toxin [Chitinilyticum litopenaei]|uniref:type II toxin-antitoxin system RelE/ParE family toxin n=1 Tax=Chitinilyticum litopenaei TaxID=1121276 RepID=UPI001FDFFE11|nr:type II toxin-antitoxin system RelE/ParE family toxin [Chitinilyticum litopenaei]